MQHEKQLSRGKFTPHNLSSAETRDLQDKLNDPMVFDVFNRLERGQDGTGCFLALYKAAREGKLSKSQTFMDICSVFEEKLRRASSSNPNSKFGIRYNENYKNFMILMRGDGGNSARQYSILQSQIGGPSMRSIRYVCCLL